MDFKLSESQIEFVNQIKEYTSKLKSKAVEFEKQQEIPNEVIKELAKLGLLGVNISSDFGGAQLGALATSLAITELASISPSIAVTVSVTNMVGEIIQQFGTDSQKNTYLPSLTSGGFFAGAFALSEAASGSDAGSLRTKAVKEENGYRINGEKMWITSGDKAGVIVLWARTSGSGTKGISTFLMPGDAKGLISSKGEDKMGLRGSHTTTLTFEDCLAPFDAILGDENRGFRVAMTALDGGRIGIASQALGMIRRLRDECALFLAEQKPNTLGDGQAISFMLADIETLYESARLITLRAAQLKEDGKSRFSEQAAMAKYYTTETVNKVASIARDILGLEALYHDHPLERLLRDARVSTIYEGTTQVQKMVIARSILGN